MNNNIESVAFAGFSLALRNHIFPAISTLAASKGFQMSVDEMCNHIKIAPSTPMGSQLTNTMMPTQGFSMQSGIPPISNGPPALSNLGALGAMPMSSGSKKGRSKTGVPTQPVADHERCQYMITRGRNKGTRCELRAEAGGVFCSGCKGKKSAQQQLQTGGAPVTGGNSMISGVPLPGMAPMSTGTLNQLNPSLTSGLSTMAPQQNTAPKLKVNQIGNGMYLELDHNLLIKTGMTPNDYICLGVYDSKSGQTTALTPDKIEICKKLNLSYVDPSKQDTSVQQSSLPALPNVNGQMLPTVNHQMPGVNLQNTPPKTGLPSVSAMPTQQFGLPQVPAVQSMGIMPAVTNVRNPDDPEDYEDDPDEDDNDDDN